METRSNKINIGKDNNGVSDGEGAGRPRDRNVWQHVTERQTVGAIIKSPGGYEEEEKFKDTIDEEVADGQGSRVDSTDDARIEPSLR